MTTPAAAPETKPPNRRRRRLLIGCVAALAFACLAAGGVGAFIFFRDRMGSAEEPAVAYILDTSPRMSLSGEEGTRLAIAQAILAEIVRPADPTYTTGLRVFGSGARPQPCEDTDLVVPFSAANQSAIADRLLGLQVGAAAESALAEAMLAAIRDLDTARGPHYIVVVTGGADSCNPQAGELIVSEAERVGISLETYVVGFQVTEQDAAALKTMSEAATGATYYDAPNAAALRSVLGSIQRRIEQPAAAAGDYEAQTACDHPYFPLRPGATWTFASEGFTYSWTVSAVSGDLNNATATIVMGFEGGSSGFEWSCSSDGVFSYDVGSFAADTLGTIGSYSVTSQSGARFPPAAELEAGASWTSEYTYTIETGIEGFSTSLTTQIQESHTAGAMQSLTTGLGTFDAVPISTTTTSTSTTDFGSFASSSSSTCWFAHGVGMVSCDSDSEGFSSHSELVSYSVP
jgi:hypothetical protein